MQILSASLDCPRGVPLSELHLMLIQSRRTLQ